MTREEMRLRISTSLSGLTPEEKGELWDAINEYAESCGGYTGYKPSIRRMKAVVEVEKALQGIVDHVIEVCQRKSFGT